MICVGNYKVRQSLIYFEGGSGGVTTWEGSNRSGGSNRTGGNDGSGAASSSMGSPGFSGSMRFRCDSSSMSSGLAGSDSSAEA